MSLCLTSARDPLRANRDIEDPETSRALYDLVFNLRAADNEIYVKEADAVWNTIAETALKGEDLAKFMKHLKDEE